MSKDHGISENGKKVPTNGIKSGHPLPQKDVKKNGGKVVNGFHKKNDLVSPTAVKDQLYNGRSSSSESHHLLERINGSSLQTRSKQSHYRLSEIPQILIDSATSTMIAILSMNIPYATAAHSIRNDARVLLRRLIRSGRISARGQLSGIPIGSSYTDSASSRFMQLLQSVALSRSENSIGDVWSTYTPFDLICDMFENCADISERQMVVALRYTLFHTRPIDVASYFVRNKNVIGMDNLRKIGSNLILVHKKENDIQ